MSKTVTDVLAERFTAYLPMDRRHAIQHEQTIPEQSCGSALLVDLVGFSALSEELRERYGVKRAAEELTVYINQVCDSWIAEVHRYGGSVVAFSGDAVTCWFQDDDGLRALACGVVLPRVTRNITPGQSTDQLAARSAKVAVAAGVAHRYLVGDPQVRLIELLTGDIIGVLANLIKTASPGEVRIEPSLWRTLQDSIDVSNDRKLTDEDSVSVTALSVEIPARPWLSQPVVSAEQSRQWLLPNMANRIAGTGESFLAEIRPVTVMFIGVSDASNVSVADFEQKLNDYIVWVQHKVKKYEGDLVELSVGDKGLYYYITFGAVISHPDDVLRALSVAHTLLDPPDTGIGQSIKVGISQGELFVGPYGSSSRRCFGVQGKEANVGAHLMTLAGSNQILVTKTVAEVASANYVFSSDDSFVVKGLRVPFYQVIERKHEPAVEVKAGPMVGRQREWLRYLSVLSAHGSKDNKAVIVEAPAGYGKSRFLAEAVDEAESTGFVVLSGSANQIEQDAPLHAWRGVLRSLLSTDKTASSAETLAHIIEVCKQHDIDTEYLPLLNLPLMISAVETATTEPLDGKQRLDATVSFILTLLERLVHGPCIVRIEDIQWADALSYAVCQRLMEENSDCLLLMSLRSSTDEVEKNTLLSSDSVVHLNLKPLSPDATCELACSALGVDQISTELAELLFAKADGHPLFTEELVFALRDAGLINIKDKTAAYVAVSADSVELPITDTLQSTIIGRVDRLNIDQQFVLKIASVIGQTFWRTTLEDTWSLGGKEGDLTAMLSDLHRQKITPQVANGDLPVYKFRHALTRDVVYDQMLTSQKNILHRSIAGWYERFYQNDLYPQSQILAYHWSFVSLADPNDEEALEKAVRYLSQSSAQSSNTGAPLDSVRMGLKALSLLGVDIPINPEAAHRSIAAEEKKIDSLLSRKEINDIQNLHPLDDPRVGRQIELILDTMPAAFMGQRGEIFALLGLTGMRLTLAHGVGPATPVVFSMYAILRRNMHQDAAGAHKWSTAALQLDRNTGKYTYPVVTFIHTWFVDMWVHPLRESIEPALQAGNYGLECGNVRYGCFCLSGHVLYTAASGLPLEHVKAVSRSQLDVIDNRVLSSKFHCLLELQFAKALMGETRAPDSLSDGEFDEQNDVASILHTDQYNQMAYYHIARCKLAYFNGDFSAALQAGDLGFNLLPACGGQVAEMELRFYLTMAVMAQYLKVLDPLLLERAMSEVTVIEGWDNLCAANFRHMLQLVNAELAYADKHFDIAYELYQLAAHSALENGYLQYHALALELFAVRTACHQGGDRAARFKAAEAAYREWGATAKADQLSSDMSTA